MTKETAVEPPELPRVKLISLKETWTCPKCTYQNTALSYERGGDCESVCGVCMTHVLLGVFRTLPDIAQWLPIEFAPKDGTWQVVARLNSDLVTPIWWERAAWIPKRSQWSSSGGVCEPTHYLPLPATQGTSSSEASYSPNDPTARSVLHDPDEVLRMLALRKELDPDAPDAVVFPESSASSPDSDVQPDLKR